MRGYEFRRAWQLRRVRVPRLRTVCRVASVPHDCVEDLGRPGYRTWGNPDCPTYYAMTAEEVVVEMHKALGLGDPRG